MKMIIDNGKYGHDNSQQLLLFTSLSSWNMYTITVILLVLVLVSAGMEPCLREHMDDRGKRTQHYHSIGFHFIITCLFAIISQLLVFTISPKSSKEGSTKHS
jgi:hypothetical protein